MVQVALNKKNYFISKITARRARVLAQMVECLASKYKTLSSNPNIALPKMREYQ
jgi:hypothetical protein